MDFRTIFQFRDKKIWWLDVIFYFAVSLLVATILCYLIFIIKNIIQKNQIIETEKDLLTVGTAEQKEQETKVILYKQKIKDFSDLIENHEFASNVFAFIEENTQPNVWFKQFNLDAKGNQVQLMGQAESMDAFSRQTDTFEKNEYVKSLGTLNSSLVDSEQIDFNLTLTLNPEIFSYLLNIKNQAIAEETERVVVVSGSLTGVTDLTAQEQPVEGEAVKTEEPKSSEKIIFAFDIPLNPEVVGTIDQTAHTILIDIPSGTDLKTLSPTIIFSDKATIYPQSDTPQNFSNPVVYQVTAQDGSTQDYTVSARIVKTQEEIEAETKPGMSGIVIVFLVIACISFLIIAGLTVFLFIKNKKKKVVARKK